MKDQYGLVSDLDNFNNSRFCCTKGKLLKMDLFFSNDEKFKSFSVNMDLLSYSNLMKEHHLSLIGSQVGDTFSLTRNAADDFNADSANPYT